jgi:hypothetical protein
MSPLRRVAVAASTTAMKNQPLNVSDQHRLVTAVPRRHLPLFAAPVPKQTSTIR